MKKVVKSSFSIFLSVIVLISSSGLFLNRMECLISGNSMISLTPFESCPLDTDTKLSNECCNISHLLLKMKIDAQTGQQSFDQSYWQGPAIPIETSVQIATHVQQSITLFADLPPPKKSGTKLALLQAYLI